MMLQILDSYDWREAFQYAVCSDDHDMYYGCGFENCDFRREDVREILYIQEGENDGPSWIIAGILNDLRYFFLSAGCDYTGWD